MKALGDEEAVSGPDQDLARKNERLRREIRILREAWEMRKTCSGLRPDCAQ